MKQRSAQTGSLLGYLLVAGVLTILLVGGLFWVQRYKMGIDTPKVVTTQDEDKNSSKKAEPDAKDRQDAVDTNKDTEKAPADTDTSVESTQKTSSAATESELPTTGPKETFASVIAITILGYAAALYARSRRAIN